MAQDAEEAPPPYFGIVPDEALAELDAPVGTRDFAAIAALCARGRDDLVGRGHEAGGAQAAAAVLDLGDHPLPDPGGAGALPPGAARQPRPAPGPHRDRRRRASGSPSTRCCGSGRISPPRAAAPSPTALAPGGAAGQGRGDRQLQGRGRQDLDGGAPRDVGGARRLPGAGRRPRQPGLDDLDLRRPGRQRMGHGLPADRARLRARAAGREPPPRRARRGAAAARGDARRRAGARPPPT